MSNDDFDDLDALMDEIVIPDDVDFLRESQSPSGGAVLVGNKSNPFDEGSDEDDDDEGDEDDIEGSNAPDRILTRGQGGGKRAVDVDDADVNKALQAIREYASKQNKYEKTAAQNKQVEAFVQEIGGWALGDTSVIDVVGAGGEVQAAEPQQGSKNLLKLLRPDEGNPGLGPPILRRDVLEKKGTESVVKRTNAREVTLTAEALVVCKRVKKRKGGGGGRERANTGAAAGKKGREGGGDNDDDDDDDDDAEADEDAPGGALGLEVKQFEMLSDLILIDLSKTQMLSLPDDAASRGSDSDSTTSRPSTPSGRKTPPPGGASTPDQPQPERPSRNPFKNMFHRRKNRSSIVNNIIASPPVDRSGQTSQTGKPVDIVALSGRLQSPSGTAVTPSGGLVHNGIGLVTPHRTYIFVCPSASSHEAWIALLHAAISAAHERTVKARRSGGEKLPPYWRHLVSRTSVYTACCTKDLPMLKATATPANSSRRDPGGYSPLHYAAMTSDCDAMNHLLDLGADPNSLELTSCRTPLFYSVEGHDSDATRVLVANGGEVDVVDASGLGLGHALVDGGEALLSCADNILGLLTQHGMSPNQEAEGEGSTPLHRASERAMAGMIRVFVDRGGELSVRRSSDGLTALQLACANPFGAAGGKGSDDDLAMFDVETVRTLIGCGACPNLPVRSDAGRRGSVASREEGNGKGCMELLIAGRDGGLLVAGEGDGEKVIDEQWCYKVFVGVMELLRSGARVSDDLEAMLNANLQDIFKQGRAEWQAKKIEKEGLIQYAHHLFQGVHKDSWESDSASSACMLCECLFTATNRRHHCRMCGILACGRCTGKSMVVASSMAAAGSKGEGGGGDLFGGVFKSLTGGDKGPKEERVCDCCFNRTASKLLELQTEAADRVKLAARIEREMAEADKRDFEETRGELFRGADRGRSPSSTAGGVGGAHSTMNEAMKNMGERGEKLEALGEKSAQLKNAAADFKDMAGQLKRSQQKKNNRFGV